MLPPANVSEAVLDHDYTFLALKRYADAARDIWTSTIQGMMKMEVNMVEPVRNFVQNDLRAFKVWLIEQPSYKSLELTRYLGRSPQSRIDSESF